MNTPRRIDILTLTDRYMEPLQPGDEAFHAMLFPARHPSDTPIYRLVRQGGSWNPLTGAFYQRVQQLTDRGVHVRRLALTAMPGTFNCDSAELIAHRNILEATKVTGEETRVFGIQAALHGLRMACGDSPYARRYLSGLQSRGDGTYDPRGSFWSVRRASTDDQRPIHTMPAHMVSLIDYQDGRCLGHEPRDGDTLRTDNDLRKFEGYWRHLYEQASPL